MKKMLQWIQNKADIVATNASTPDTLSTAFGAGALALVASLFLPVAPWLSILIIASPVTTYGAARMIGSTCRMIAPSAV
jgi:hypothetical protein